MTGDRTLGEAAGQAKTRSLYIHPRPGRTHIVRYFLGLSDSDKETMLSHGFKELRAYRTREHRLPAKVVVRYGPGMSEPHVEVISRKR